MDVDKALRDLYAEKKRLDRAIAALEAKLSGSQLQAVSKTSPRGRRSMSEAERQELRALVREAEEITLENARQLAEQRQQLGTP